MEGFYTTGDHNLIRHHGSTHPGESFEYGSGGGRYERAVGTSAQIQSGILLKASQDIKPKSSTDSVGATSQIKSPLYPAEKIVYTESSDHPVKNELPLSHPRQDESRLLNHLLTNYDKRVRPILDAKKNITIYVGITLTQIFDMVSKSFFNIVSLTLLYILFIL